MKKVLLLLLVGLTPLLLFAQKNGSVKGLVYDSVAKQGIGSATVTVLLKKDSSLVAFMMTDDNGRFEVTKLANGQYRLLITHINYHNTSKNFTIDDSSKLRDLGHIYVSDTSKMLEEVVVTAEAPPITLLGDTIQYNAGSFKVQPNAVVEDLLKKLPGVKVDRDGKITAQGKEVKKVMVDGKEFFGNDPKMATKNLTADAVDKVQVYEKSSDAAQLTGFDDGNSETTINLKLKKDKTKGMFGKVMAGGGTDGRFEGRFNVNSFKGARQLSVLGMTNNTNAEAFSFSDMLGFSGGFKGLGGGGTVSASVTMPDGGGSGNNNIRTILGGGFNYNNIIGSKTDFTSNYFYNRYNPKTISNTQREYLLPDSSSYYRQDAVSDNINNSHKLNLSADIQLDSFHSIKISPSFGYQDVNNKQHKTYQTLSGDYQPANEGYSNNITSNNGFNFSNTLLFRKKWRTKGRTLSLSLATNLNQSDGEGLLESVNKYYNTDGSLFRQDSINQKNTNTADQRGYNVRAVYTEPLFRRSLLEFSVGNTFARNNSNKITCDRNKTNGKYDVLNEQLTNDFENKYGTTTGGIRLRTKKKKFDYSVGATWQQAMLDGQFSTGVKDSTLKKTFRNILPNASFKYNFSSTRNLNLMYTTNTSQPSISQLQPVPDVSDPLNIWEGNPDLKQELSHNVSLMFMSVNPFQSRSLFAYVNFRQTQNSIVNSDTMDALGVKRTRPVNVNGVYNFSANVSLGLPLPFWSGSIRMGTKMSYNNGKQFINKVTNNIRTFTAGPDLRLDFNPLDKIDFSIGASYNYNNTRYSLRPSMNTNYFNHQYEADINWQLPKNIFFNTAFTYTINNQLAEGFNARVPLWNASISKQFLRYNRGELKLTAYDLLKQNVGVTRNTSQNYIEDVRTSTLQRFFLLSFTYSLTKSGAASVGSKQSIQFIRR